MSDDLGAVRERLAALEADAKHYMTETKLRAIIREEMSAALINYGHETASQIDKRVVRHETDKHRAEPGAPGHTMRDDVPMHWLWVGALALLAIGALLGRAVFALLSVVAPDFTELMGRF